jgi:hypothetical protein
MFSLVLSASAGGATGRSVQHSVEFLHGCFAFLPGDIVTANVIFNRHHDMPPKLTISSVNPLVSNQKLDPIQGVSSYVIDFFAIRSVENGSSHLTRQPVRIPARDVGLVEEHRADAPCYLLDVEDADRLNVLVDRELESQWKSIRTSNGIERLHEEFKRRIKTQTVLPSAETEAMLFWALLASGQITMTTPVAKTIKTLLGAPSLILPGEETKQ